jgi:hypothetical protein
VWRGASATHRPPRLARGHRRQREVGEHRAEADQAGAAECLCPLARDLERLERGIQREEGQQADGRGKQEPNPGRVDPAHERQPQHPERDRDDADVDAEQRHQPEEREVGGRGLDCHRDLVGDRPPGRGQQHHLVRLALHPRLRDPHGGGLEPPDGRVAARELHERVVDHRLRDRHRVRAVVAHRQLDHARRQRSALDDKLLGRRPPPLGQPRPVEQGEGGHRGDDQQQRHQRERPHRYAR